MISIAMTAYKRAELLKKTLQSIREQSIEDALEIVVVEDGNDGGATEAVCRDFGGVSFYRRINRPETPYSSPAVPINIGLRRAHGEIIVIQNAECCYATPDSLSQMLQPVRESQRNVAFASVMALNQSGGDYSWYCHPEHSARPFFFCGALHRSFVDQLRGMDEDFKWYGYDDDDWALRLQFSGAHFVFTKARVNHQWHPGTDCFGLDTNYELFTKKTSALVNGEIGVERNLGRDWGSLDS